MPNTISELEILTTDMFDNELGREIIAEMKADQLQAEGELGDMGAVSIGTFFAGDRLYKKTGTGKFEGLPNVIWNGQFENDKTPKFLFQPGGSAPFRFTSSTGRVIEPKLMDTDGGSIPRILHGLSKFSPWGYAPGYIIHDWVFVAHKCKESPDDDITFDESAILLAECIKTMMEVGFRDFDGDIRKFKKAEDTMYLIYKAVSSKIARRLWDDTSSVVCR